MSRKHFQALADEIKAEVEDIRRSPESDQVKDVALAVAEDMARAVARVCRASNGRFDYDLFMAACGF